MDTNDTEKYIVTPQQIPEAPVSDSLENTARLWDRIGVFVINLDRAPQRMERIRQDFDAAGIPFTRLSATDGKTIKSLPSTFCKWYFLCHYRRNIQVNELGCYLSHLNALQTFLDSNKEFGLICEDDTSPDKESVQVLSALLEYSDAWELVRLHHYSKHYIVWQNLQCNYKLVTPVQCMNGTASYLISRKGAERFLRKAKKIRLHYDTALYSGWVGVREMAVVPPLFPINENSFVSNINVLPQKHLYSILIPTRWLSKLYLHVRRYSLQLFRAIRLKFFYNGHKL